MRALTQKEAIAVAKKLHAEILHGSDHDQAIIRFNGRIVARYGIRRSSKDVGHDFMPQQLFISLRQTFDLARCPLSREAYFDILRSKGMLNEST
jgi:hypothetical protein